MDLTYDKHKNLKEISDLKSEILKVEKEIEPLDKEFLEIAECIKEREGK